MKTIIYLLSIFFICLTTGKFTYGQNRDTLPLTRTSTIYNGIFMVDKKEVLYPAIGQLVEYSNNLYRIQKENNCLMYLHINRATIPPNKEYEIKVKIGMSGTYTFLGSMRFIASQDKYSANYNENIPLMIYLWPQFAPSAGGGILWIELFDNSGNQLDSYHLNVWLY